MQGEIKVESIFHPSDFSEASAIAFVHALKLALATRSRFSIMHVAVDHSTEWQDFPGVRETLERWQLIPGVVRKALSDSWVSTFSRSSVTARTR